MLRNIIAWVATAVAFAGIDFIWLENTGLDRSMGRRGMAICEAGAGERAAAASAALSRREKEAPSALARQSLVSCPPP